MPQVRGQPPLTTTRCRGRGGAAAVAGAVAGHTLFLVECGGGKTGGREAEKETKRMRNKQRHG